MVILIFQSFARQSTMSATGSVSRQNSSNIHSTLLSPNSNSAAISQNLQPLLESDETKGELTNGRKFRSTVTRNNVGENVRRSVIKRRIENVGRETTTNASIR